MGNPIYFYVLFKTVAPDGSTFFGIHRTQNPTYGQDGLPIEYIGSGKRLQDKVRQFGIQSMSTEVIQIDGDYNTIKRSLDRILTPATLADPRCLNIAPQVTAQNISEALTDKPKSEFHKVHISTAMYANDNAIGHVKSEEAKEAISETKSNQKLKWYHNPETAEEITLPEDEDCLTGFVIGRLPKELKAKFNKERKASLSDADRARLIKD